MTKFRLSIHAHFHHPPRANPMTGVIGSESSAAPFRNWNERVTEEIYRPNAQRGNFERLSLDISETFMQWLSARASETYSAITNSVRTYEKLNGVSNVLATPLHPAPLPLLPARDRLTQLVWGRNAAIKRFGIVPQGVFLPEFAADLGTLQAAADAGFRYTLLRVHQVEGLPERGGAGPYQVALPNGTTIDVFVVDDALTTSMQKEMVERGGAGYWARTELLSHCRFAGPLTLLYLDGEEIGGAHMAEAAFVQYLLSHEARACGYEPVTLEQYYAAYDGPRATIGVLPYQAPDISPRQRDLYAALERIMPEADLIFRDEIGESAWALRNQAYGGEFPSAYRHLLQSQIALQEAWSNVYALERHPQIGNDHILMEVAYAVVLMQHQAKANLATTFTESLAEPLVKQFEKHMARIEQDLAARAG
ncbi:MAG: hypothetical protein ACLFTK_08250 [Anaerolineales bacterium]